ncbi:sensor histidine kinase, partial [Stieleria sp.]|uniref:sensor histidine kinase n=1 Tax=Stieleria sp. TaxID=2795976 RepID=UPI003561C280
RAEQEVRERTREVIQNEQLASVGFLAAGVAHEINNPLGAIAWGAEALEGTLEDLPAEEKERFNQEFLQELQTNLGLIQSEAFRCKGITQRLLNFSRLSNSSRNQEDLGQLVAGVVSMVGKVGEYRCKTIRTHADESVTAYCNSQEIQQVVLNLVSNALESVDTDGNVDVYVRHEIDPFSGTKEAVVEVKDDGCGMDQEVMDHLFEPFFTRRRDDSGTGLGLSISYRIVSLHHGSLTPQSEGEGRGSKMILRLPTEPAKKESPSDSTFYASRELNDHDELPSSTKWNDVQKVA